MKVELIKFHFHFLPITEFVLKLVGKTKWNLKKVKEEVGDDDEGVSEVTASPFL